MAFSVGSHERVEIIPEIVLQLKQIGFSFAVLFYCLPYSFFGSLPMQTTGTVETFPDNETKASNRIY